MLKVDCAVLYVTSCLQTSIYAYFFLISSVLCLRVDGGILVLAASEELHDRQPKEPHQVRLTASQSPNQIHVPSI